jgi:hypothetical protein
VQNKLHGVEVVLLGHFAAQDRDGLAGDTHAVAAHPDAQNAAPG